jgi:adenosylhomocysteine nucleosidase
MATAASVVAVVGMRSEARLLPPGIRAVIAGGDPRRLAALLAAEPGEVAAVLSFGIAGGLDPALGAGDLVVATRVRGPRGAWRADLGWAAALARATGARLGVVAGAAVVVADPAAKRNLRSATDALAVDLESEAAAAFAASRGLPFVALRAIADTAEEVLPRAAAVGLTADGRPAPGRVALALLRRPGDLPALVQVARRTREALAALERAAKALPASAPSAAR